MTNIFNKVAIVGVSLCSLFFHSCTNFLEVDPSSAYITDKSIRTPEDVNMLVVGEYNALRDLYGETIYLLNENRSDNAYINQTEYTANLYRLEIMRFEESKLNSALTKAWNQHWRSVGRANFCLQMIDKFDTSIPGNEIIATYTGETKFLRALFYFNLVRIFGEVPIVTKMGTELSDADTHVKRSLKDIYAFIIKDLEDAYQLLPMVELQIGRVNKACALGLLGKVYLTMAGYPYNNQKRNPDGISAMECYELADETLKKITEDPEFTALYQLHNNYAELFDPYKKNMSPTSKVNREDLLSVQYKSGTGIGLGSPFNKSFGARDYTFQIINGGNGGCLPTSDLMDCYVWTGKADPLNKNIVMADPAAPRDARGMAIPATVAKTAYGLGATITGCVAGFGGDGVYITGKYLNLTSPSSINNDGEHNWYILRYADILLMQAETKYELGDYQGVVDKLNQIVDRANTSLGGKGLNIMNYSLTAGDGSGLAPNDYVVLPTDDKWAGREMIQNERRRELALEGHRWFDLVRCNRYYDETDEVNHAVTIMNAFFRIRYTNYGDGLTNPWLGQKQLTQIEESQLLYPIPPLEIDLNPGLK